MQLQSPCVTRICNIVLVSFYLNQLTIQMNTINSKPSSQRNVTPNFLKYRRKSTSKSDRPEDEGLESQYPTDRSASKTSRGSFDVYQKRVLHLSKISICGFTLEGALGVKNSEGAVEVNKKRREGLQVISRRSTPNKGQGNQQELNILNLAVLKKNPINHSYKATKLGNQSRQKSHKYSNPKRSEQSLQKEEERAKIQNKELMNTLMQQNFPPNYLNKLKIKKMQQKQQKEQKELRDKKEERQKNKAIAPQRRFLQVDLQMKGQQQLKNYHVYEQLGKGAYGVVKMGMNKLNNQKVAIKIYEKRRLDQPNKLRNLQRQINILAKLSHPVIAKLLDSIQGSSEIFLIQEYGGANSLYNYLISKPQHRLQEQEAKLFFKTIAETLKYLHKRNIVHRDIKAQNILLNRNKQLKLIDFGFSIQSVPPNTIDTFCGTPTYMAPEIVSKKDHVPIYTDLWSLGVFLFVILQGNYPFRAKQEADLFEKIRKGHFQYIYKDISEKSRHVIQRLIRVNPLERMSTEDMNESFWQWYLSDSGKSYYVQNTTATNLTTYSN